MPTAPDHPRLRPVVGAAFIVVATLLAYLPAVRGGFIWDDDQHVTENVLLRNAEGLRFIWTRLGATPQYYPLTHTSFWIEYQLWRDRPMGYHIVNVVLHIGSALLLWRILVVLGLRAAWLAAAIFALHPIEVESVAWVTERKNVLSGILYFAALLMYLRAAGVGARAAGVRAGAALRFAPAWGWYIASLGLFVSAVLSKTVAGTLPAAIVLILWWKSGRLPWKHVLFLLPMFAFAIVFGSITSWMERTHVGAFGPDWHYSFVERLLIATRALWFYAYKLVLPWNLTFIYPRWEIDARSVAQWLIPLATVCVVGLLVLKLKSWGRGPLVCVLYFIGTLFPALGFVNIYPMRFSFVADHFQYLAGVGLIVLMAELLLRGLGLAAGRDLLLMPLPLLLAVLTWRQCHMYRDERTLWETTLARNPGAWIAHDHLGGIIGTSDIETALGHYVEAQRLNPDHLEGYIGLGNLLLQINRPDAAVEQYRKAVEIRNDHPTPYYALGGGLSAAGDLEGAVDAYEQALRIEPKFLPARLKLIELYTRLGRRDDAERHRTEAARQREQILGR